MDMLTFSAKTVDEAVTKALIDLGTTSDKLEYEVIEKGSAGFLGIGAKPAIIRARKKESIQDNAVDFLAQIFDAMNMEVTIAAAFNEEEKELSITLEGDDMGILIGKRGQTLDSLQYLVSLIVNKNSDGYLRVKLDTENYREKRKNAGDAGKEYRIQGKADQTSGVPGADESLRAQNHPRGSAERQVRSDQKRGRGAFPPCGDRAEEGSSGKARAL